mmetsp:Transcript_30343/g.104791  ORF Transcript_30343/g.104791 Transcript_30343/m.104791 type:complete len:267 (-) Transcript_30343:642-1442(-)
MRQVDDAVHRLAGLVARRGCVGVRRVGRRERRGSAAACIGFPGERVAPCGAVPGHPVDVAASVSESGAVGQSNGGKVDELLQRALGAEAVGAERPRRRRVRVAAGHAEQGPDALVGSVSCHFHHGVVHARPAAAVPFQVRRVALRVLVVVGDERARRRVDVVAVREESRRARKLFSPKNVRRQRVVGHGSLGVAPREGKPRGPERSQLWLSQESRGLGLHVSDVAIFPLHAAQVRHLPDAVDVDHGAVASDLRGVGHVRREDREFV